MFIAAQYGHVGAVAELIAGKASPGRLRQVLPGMHIVSTRIVVKKEFCFIAEFELKYTMLRFLS